MKRALAPALLLVLGHAARLESKGLAITTDYQLRALSYTNLNFNSSGNDQSFFSQSARLGMEFKDILLRSSLGVPETMDIGIRLRALGVTGSTAPFTPPFDRIAANYPSADHTPFIENAYIRTHNLGGAAWDLTAGRQPFRLGSGLLLDDNGAGLTGLSTKCDLPWGLKAQAFAFQAQSRNVRFGPGNASYFGFTVEKPSQGTWQLHQLFERDLTTQHVAVNGCQGLDPDGCLVGRATRWFSSVRYQLNYGPLVFDGEVALQRGAANPTGPKPAGSHVTFNGNAQLVRAKWKQSFYTSKKTGRIVRGIARLSLARGSGDDHGTGADEAFFPSHGLRYDGLERTGIGEYFAATPYDGFGGQSTTTASGLPRRASGVVAVGGGITPPAWNGVTMDIDYFVYQVDRNVGPHRTLGNELDVRLRYDYQDFLSFRASVASFKAGAALNTQKPSGRRYQFEIVGRFY